MARSYKAAVKAQSTVDYSPDDADAANGVVNDSVAVAATPAFRAEEAVVEADEEALAEYSNAGRFMFNLYTSNICKVYEDRTDYINSDGDVIATAYVNSAPEYTCIGCYDAKLCEAESGYYINYNSNGENIVIFLSSEEYGEELAESVADSVIYN